MKSYTDFTNFLGYVHDNALFEIKIELTAMIILLKGNRKKIDDAIAFAIANSDFDFDKHQPSHSNISLTTNEDKFVFEKGELLNNFSKERLDEVIKIYPLMYKEKNINNVVKQDEYPNSTDDNTLKNVTIVVGAALGAYLLYQLFK
jgi:hypothetical protein